MTGRSPFWQMLKKINVGHIATGTRHWYAQNSVDYKPTLFAGVIALSEFFKNYQFSFQIRLTLIFQISKLFSVFYFIIH